MYDIFHPRHKVMSIESPRKPDLVPASIRSHVQDAINEVNERNQAERAVFYESVRLAKRQQLIRIATAETAVKLIESLPIEWVKVSDSKVAGELDLSIDRTPLTLLSPEGRLVTILSAHRTGSENLKHFKLTVERQEPREISRDEQKLNLHQMSLSLADKENGSLGVRISWEQSEVEVTDASIEFSYNINNKLVRYSLGRQQIINPDDMWKDLYETAGFLTIIEKAEVVLDQPKDLSDVS